MKRLSTALLLFLCPAVLSHAAILEFYAPLAPEAVGATGSGRSTFTFDTTAQTLDISFFWSGLSGLTTVSHIHCCTAVPGAGTAGVAVTPGTLPGFPAGVSSGSYSVSLDLSLTTTYTDGFREAGSLTAAEASEKLLQGIIDGRAYLNVHSSTFPGGEIRGFLAPVPEPATFGFAGAALSGLLLTRRFCAR